jgi:hypothetical protein
VKCSIVEDFAISRDQTAVTLIALSQEMTKKVEAEAMYSHHFAAESTTVRKLQVERQPCERL